MILRDGRNCFKKRNWIAVFPPGGSFLLSSPDCITLQWSKQQVADLFAKADSDILRRDVMRRIYKDSVTWFDNAAKLFDVYDTSLIFSLLTSQVKPQHFTIEQGHISFRKLNRLNQAGNAKELKFPGVKVLV